MFTPDLLYFTDDPALKALAANQTMAQWRSEGRGPAYIKIGSRVAYRGSDLNAWLAAQTIRPGTARSPEPTDDPPIAA